MKSVILCVRWEAGARFRRGSGICAVVGVRPYICVGGVQGSNMLHRRPGAATALACHTCSNFALFTLALVRGKDTAGLWKVDA